MATASRPSLGIALLCLALLGVPATGFAGADAFALPAPLGWETPQAATLEVTAAPQPVSEVSARLPSRAFAARTEPHAAPPPPASAPARIAERELRGSTSPLLRWRLAHSTSSGID